MMKLSLLSYPCYPIALPLFRVRVTGKISASPNRSHAESSIEAQQPTIP